MTAQNLTSENTASTDQATEVNHAKRLARLINHFREEIVQEERKKSGQGRMKHWVVTIDGAWAEEEAMRRVLASGAFTATDAWVPVKLRRVMDGQ